MSNRTIHTKFGNARLDSRGYYYITSRKEGNYQKPLHKLIFEDYYKCTVLPKHIIHHIDENKTNNDISNLKLMPWGEHTRVHHKNKHLSAEHKQAISNANKGHCRNVGRKHTKEARQNMSNAQKGRVITDEHKLKLSKSKNKTGYFRVSKEHSERYKHGIRYRYIYTDNGKRKEIKSVSLKKLEEKVKSKRLPWKKL